jgi:hypothetical protein
MGLLDITTSLSKIISVISCHINNIHIKEKNIVWGPKAPFYENFVCYPNKRQYSHREYIVFYIIAYGVKPPLNYGILVYFVSLLFLVC